MKNSFTILISLLFISSLSLAQENWETLNVPTGNRYDDIFFLNDQVGWAVGNIRGGTNPLRRIYKTTDGGTTWRLNGPTNFQGYLRSIEFFDANIGLCGTVNGHLFRTTDGGENWVDIISTISPKPPGVCGLAKADENTIYGVGVYYNPAFVLKSIDKGLNWTYMDMSAYATSLIDVHFFDANHGFVTGSNGDAGGVVLYTTDGGETWEEKFATGGPSERIWKIQTPDNIHFYGSIEKLIQEGETRIIRSSDAGQTWEIVTVWPEYNLCQMVGFIDTQHGWTGGYGQLFETVDGGSTWKKITLGSTHNRFFKINDDVAYLTGSKIYKFNRGEIVTGLPEEEPYSSIHKIKAFPNPTDGKIAVTVTFGSRTLAQVYLYSVSGKNLQKIFSGETEIGERKFTLDLTDQPSGTFIVTVETHEGMESIKLFKK